MLDASRLASIQLLAMDVDGVLTDGTFWWGANGEEFKRFSFEDVMGLSLGRGAGLRFALISGEASPLVDRFAEKMKIAHVFKGIKDKGAALTTLAASLELNWAQIAYMGDDVNDLSAIALAGVAVAPANAHARVKAAAHWVTTHAGGHGAVRELVDQLVDAREALAAGSA